MSTGLLKRQHCSRGCVEPGSPWKVAAAPRSAVKCVYRVLDSTVIVVVLAGVLTITSCPHGDSDRETPSATSIGTSSFPLPDDWPIPVSPPTDSVPAALPEEMQESTTSDHTRSKTTVTLKEPYESMTVTSWAIGYSNSASFDLQAQQIEAQLRPLAYRRQKRNPVDSLTYFSSDAKTTVILSSHTSPTKEDTYSIYVGISDKVISPDQAAITDAL
ncbi:hypothetical protein IT575_13275 [bacterium]|nr:hypothetical protein [bacterium]